MRIPFILLNAVAVTGLAACATYSSPQPYGGPAYGSPAYRGVLVTTASKAPFGTYLVDGGGRALYILEGTRGTPGERCGGECLRVWPPLHAGAPAAAGGSVDPARLAAIRAHGQTHVTYAGWPLFYYHHDRRPGDTTGQHVMDRWGSWHLLSPSGEPIRPMR